MKAVTACELDEAIFRGHSYNCLYEVVVRFKPMPSSRVFPKASKYWSVIDSLDVVVNGRKLKVPKKALNLFTPHTPEPPYLGPDGMLYFKIRGGSASKSYEAVYVFSQTRLIRREWRSLFHRDEESEIITKY